MYLSFIALTNHSLCRRSDSSGGSRGPLPPYFRPNWVCFETALPLSQGPDDPPPDALSRHWIVWREIESEEKNKSGREGEGKIRERHNHALSLSPLNFSPSNLSFHHPCYLPETSSTYQCTAENSYPNFHHFGKLDLYPVSFQTQDCSEKWPFHQRERTSYLVRGMRFVEGLFYMRLQFRQRKRYFSYKILSL